MGCFSMGYEVVRGAPLFNLYRLDMHNYMAQTRGLWSCRQQANAGLNTRAVTSWRRNSRRRLRHPSRDESKADDKIVITVDMQDIKRRASGFVEETGKASEAAIKGAVDKGRELWNDLRTSVAFQNDKRVVIVVRRSSIEILANAFLCSIFVTGAFKLFSRAAKKYRWGWEMQGVVRRDRSLGGRQVLVSKSPRSPLATLDDSRSEKVLLLHHKKMQHRQRKKPSPLPHWWPAPDVPPAVSIDDYNSAQSQARALLQGDKPETPQMGISSNRIGSYHGLLRTEGLHLPLDQPFFVKP